MNPSEPRAKRTHARRSCDVCKLRKTRCELPDLEVPSSSEPLPLDKSCHRCKILALPCVVDDSSRKVRKRPTEDDPNDIGTAAAAPKARRTKRQSKAYQPTEDTLDEDANTLAALGALKTLGSVLDAGNKEAGGSGGTDFNLDVMHGFHPSQSSAEWSLQKSQELSASLISDGEKMPPFGSGEPTESFQSKSIKLHGRPYELVCAMLSVAYGRKGLRRAGTESGFDLDLNALADQEMRTRLEPGMIRLRALHPSLEHISNLYSIYNSEPSLSISLLISLVLYMSSMALPPSDELVRLRSTLTPYIITLRDATLLQMPVSFISLQALELLCVHLPLGALPLQSVSPHTLSVARGQVQIMLSTSSALNFSMLLRQITHISGVGGMNPWQVNDVWLWLAMCAVEATMSLEDEVPKKPTNVADAKEVVDRFLADDFQDTWRRFGETAGAHEVLGRLSVCDRISRLSEVLDCLGRLRNGLDTAANDPNYDLVGATNEELKYFTERLAQIDAVHDGIMAVISPSSKGIESGWLAYRNLRRRFESNRVYVAGLRVLMATAYLPDYPLAFKGLPSGMHAVQKVSYAMSRVCNPPDMMPFIIQAQNPATQATWHWGRIRGQIAESVLSEFAQLESRILPPLSPGGKNKGKSIPTYTDVLPLHDALCTTVESAKVLMEMQASSIVIRKTSKLATVFDTPTWVYSLKSVADICSGIAALSPPPVSSATAGLSAERAGVDKMESIAQGCGNLVGSMLRLAEEWHRAIQREEAEANANSSSANGHDEDQRGGTGPGGEGNDLNGGYPSNGLFDDSGNSFDGGHGDGGGGGHDLGHSHDGLHDQGTTLASSMSLPPPVHHPHSHSPGHHPHTYMNTSDRWMASDHAPPGETSGMPASDPTHIDLLLSHMFNYSYPAPAPAMYTPQAMSDQHLQHQPQQSHQSNQGGMNKLQNGLGYLGPTDTHHPEHSLGMHVSVQDGPHWA